MDCFCIVLYCIIDTGQAEQLNMGFTDHQLKRVTMKEHIAL